MREWEKTLRSRLAELNLAPTRETEILEEWTLHLNDRYQELLAAGLTDKDASESVVVELASSQDLEREMQKLKRRAATPQLPLGRASDHFFTGIWQDVRFGARSLLKSPALAAVVVITLALGIAANTALFSVVNAVLLNPLPFPQPEQLVTFHQSKPNFETGAIPYPNFRDLHQQNQTFSAMAISRGYGYSLIGSGEAERVSGRQVSADFFTVYGVKPQLGRTFAPNEDEPGTGPVVVISNGLWQRKFGGSAEILQKGITLDDKTYSVIGVLPADFTLLGDLDVYVPIGQWGNPALKNRGVALGLHGIGRMKPGVTVQQAEADLNRVMRDLANTYPQTNRNNGSRVIPIMDRLVGNVRSSLWMLLGAVGFVLLIACVNVSNLLLSRSTTRTREFAIRAALGAGQWRLMRQCLIESIMLALAGGALGLLFAAWGTQAALKVLPTTLPRADEVGLDKRVLLFTFGISLLVGILSGLAPAIRSARSSLSESLKEGGRGSSIGRGRAQGIFVAVEMALALTLLIGAGLMIRSLSALWNTDPGFRAENVLTFGLTLPPSMANGTPEAVRHALHELSDSLKSIPGVRAVSFTAGAIPIQSEDDVFFWLADRPKPASTSEMNMALIYRVEPGYLDAMSIPLKQGRFFTNQDDERSQPVAVIDEVFARKYFGDSNPLGKRIAQDDNRPPAEIVGVVKHVEQWGLGARQELQAQLYEPYRQLDDANLPLRTGVLLRADSTSGDAGSVLFNNIRQVVQRQHNQNVIFQPQTMTEALAGTVSNKQFLMMLLNAFAVVAVVLASIGLYGVISYLVGQRTHELGIRLALGAQRASVLRLVLGAGMRMALAGILLGLLTAFALTRLLGTMVYGVSTTDPLTFALISLLLTTVALLACLIPALRATRVNPLVALRYE